MKILDMNDLLGLTGLGLVTYGLWLIFPPVSFVVCGSLLMAVALIRAKR